MTRMEWYLEKLSFTSNTEIQDCIYSQIIRANTTNKIVEDALLLVIARLVLYMEKPDRQFGKCIQGSFSLLAMNRTHRIILMIIDYLISLINSSNKNNYNLIKAI